MQLLSTKCDFAINGHWQNLGTFLVVTVGKGMGHIPGIWWIEARETVYTPYRAQGSPCDTQLLTVIINSTD